MAVPRTRTRRIASSAASTPAMTPAASSPTLCPAATSAGTSRVTAGQGRGRDDRGRHEQRLRDRGVPDLIGARRGTEPDEVTAR